MARNRENQRGVALVVVALFLGLFLAITALGIDVSRLAHVATEVQTVADAAARGGAKALADNGGTANTGIVRAHLIAGENDMNGDAATDANDVLVDEGNYNTETNQFQCCTHNTPCCGGGGGALGGLTCTGGCSAGSRRLAVLAAPQTTVDNFLAGIFNFMDNGVLVGTANGATNQHSTVQKIAVATTTGPASGCSVPPGCAVGNWGCYCDHGVAPCLPIAAPSCEFPPGCTGVACQLPNLQVSSARSDSAGWTGFDLNANDPNVRAYLTQGPCHAPGQTDRIDLQSTGTSISLNNGLDGAAQNQLFGLTQCLAGLAPAPRNVPQGCFADANGNIVPGRRGTVFTMPIFTSCSGSCSGNFNNSCSNVIAGFATIQITAVNVNPPAPRTISITTIRNTTSTQSQPGGGCFGTDCRITMVR